MTAPFIDTDDLTLTATNQVMYASARIREYCGWHIYPSMETTVEIDLDGGRRVFLPSLHVTALTSVVETNYRDDDSETTLTAGTDYRQMKKAGGSILRRRHRDWPEGVLEVVFTHGYDTLPDGLAEVTIAVAKRMPSELASVSQEQALGVSRTYGGLLGGQGALNAVFTAAEQMILDNYRLRNSR